MVSEHVSESEKLYCDRAEISDDENSDESDYDYGNVLEPTDTGHEDVSMTDKQEMDESDDDVKMVSTECNSNTHNTNNVNFHSL